jgi:phycobilisome rod-core linker protein
VVDLTFKRFLGRSTYGKDEQIAWSIVIATKGLHGFIDAVVDSAEYTANFGDDIVPYQRRRFDGRPINLVNPRYDSHWRNRQIEIQGISYYTVGKGDGRANKLPVGQAIPANFMAMAKGMITPQFNYQRTIATVTSQVRNMELIDNSRDGETPKPPVTRTDAALPYRYIPSLPKY